MFPTLSFDGRGVNGLWIVSVQAIAAGQRNGWGPAAYLPNPSLARFASAVGCVGVCWLRGRGRLETGHYAECGGEFPIGLSWWWIQVAVVVVAWRMGSCWVWGAVGGSWKAWSALGITWIEEGERGEGRGVRGGMGAPAGTGERVGGVGWD